MWRMIGLGSLIGVLAANAAASNLQAQQLQRDTSIAVAVARVRIAGSHQAATAILTQARGPQPRQKLDALADSLVEIAIAYRPGDPADRERAASVARVAIALAGRRNPPGGGAPYAGAFIRLVRIYEGSEDVGHAAATLWLMTQLADLDAVFSYLQQVATSDDRVAHRAVELLARETGPEGLALLRQIYRAGNVTEPTARVRLEGIAEYHEWRD